MTHTQKRDALSVEIKTLEGVRDKLFHSGNQLCLSALKYMEINKSLEQKEEAINNLAEVYLRDYRKRFLTIEEVAEHLSLDPKMLFEIIDNPQKHCDFRPYLFASDSKQDHYRISVRELARHVIENSSW
jgi:hypothetical protein